MFYAMTGQVSDQVLAQRARAGDRRAFAEFAERWWPRVGRVAWIMLGNVCQAVVVTEEVLGMTLLSAQRPDVPIAISMYRLAIWHSIVRRRSGRRARPAETPILEALGRLDSKDRAAFVLRDIERLSVADAAAILESSAAEVRRGAHRARILLTRLFGDAANGTDVETDPFDLRSA